MAYREIYEKQVALLVRVLPFVADEEEFALKGGTAINLFVRDMPRLSVDIDLTYLPVADRDTSLRAIDNAMKRIADHIQKSDPLVRVTQSILQRENITNKLIVRSDDVQIKIEITPVMRGCAYEPEARSVSELVEGRFGFAEIQVVSFADLYAGKIVAALDRQHPRDLFDVRDLLANEGISDELRRAFVVYMMAHDRPMSEVLAPPRKNIEAEFERSFVGMTDKPVELAELLAARETIIETMVTGMPDNHRRFLISFEADDPQWDLFELPDAANLPAVKWRQVNFRKQSPEARASEVVKLERVLLIDEAAKASE